MELPCSICENASNGHSLCRSKTSRHRPQPLSSRAHLKEQFMISCFGLLDVWPQGQQIQSPIEPCGVRVWSNLKWGRKPVAPLKGKWLLSLHQMWKWNISCVVGFFHLKKFLKIIFTLNHFNFTYCQLFFQSHDIKKKNNLDCGLNMFCESRVYDFWSTKSFFRKGHPIPYWWSQLEL